MTDRSSQIIAFLAQHGWADTERALLAGDASNRRYDRLKRASGETAILMDAPPSTGEDTRPFVKVANYLRECGFSAPNIYAQDPDLGLLLIEDLGDDIFARVLESQPDLETAFYTAATDVLVHLHSCPPLALPIFDAPMMASQTAIVFDWYQLGASVASKTDQRAQLEAALLAELKPLDEAPKVVIQRDYHAENLLWLPERSGVARVGLLDFQDALMAHPAYDLVSILQDARRDLASGVEETMISHYLSKRPTPNFRQAYARLGLQRNLRILGIFARLCMVQGKAHYIDYIPRVWNHIQRALCTPGLEPLAQMINMSLPEPNATTLGRLKDQCGRHPLP